MSGSTQSITVLGKRKHDPNTLRLVVNHQEFSGWTSVRVTRGVERMPSDFAVGITERYPGLAQQLVINPGDACRVLIGDDLVLTGFVDRYQASVSPSGHEVTITGRGRCQDLVDSSAGVVPPGNSIGGQYAKTNVPALLAAIANPFKIEISDLTDGSLAKLEVPQFSINFGESPFDIIDRVARWAGTLAYEDATGNLVLARIGTARAASGFVQGVNVQAMSATRSLDERFSIYLGSIMSVDNLAQLRAAAGGYPFDGHYADAGVPRFRPRVIISEQMQLDQDVCAQRAVWEGKRRYGRSQQVSVTVDSWRDRPDSTGKLWTPNTLASISLPAVKVTPAEPWVIGEVTYGRGEEGTIAEISLMPQDAFLPEPTILLAVDRQVAQSLPGPAAKP